MFICKLKIFFFVLVSLYGTAIISQRAAVVYKNQLKISPFRFLDPVHSGVELSYERRHMGRYATQLSGMYFIKSNFISKYQNYNGYRIALEEKYFLSGWARILYLSAEAIYQNNSF